MADRNLEDAHESAAYEGTSSPTLGGIAPLELAREHNEGASGTCIGGDGSESDSVGCLGDHTSLLEVDPILGAQESILNRRDDSDERGDDFSQLTALTDLHTGSEGRSFTDTAKDAMYFGMAAGTLMAGVTVIVGAVAFAKVCDTLRRLNEVRRGSTWDGSYRRIELPLRIQNGFDLPLGKRHEPMPRSDALSSTERPVRLWDEQKASSSRSAMTRNIEELRRTLTESHEVVANMEILVEFGELEPSHRGVSGRFTSLHREFEKTLSELTSTVEVTSTATPTEVQTHLDTLQSDLPLWVEAAKAAAEVIESIDRNTSTAHSSSATSAQPSVDSMLDAEAGGGSDDDEAYRTAPEDGSPD